MKIMVEKYLQEQTIAIVLKILRLIKVKRLRSPIRYFGGKGNMVNRLLKYIPPHKIYVEVFGGAGALLFAKEPAGNEIYNDIDGDLVNLFKVLKDEKQFEKFYKLVSLTPYSREEYYYCYEHYKQEEDNVKRAYMFFVVLRQGFVGYISKSWGYSINPIHHNMGAVVSRYLSIIEMLPEIHQRIMRVQVENDDFRKIIPRYDTPNTFFYLDPPYIPHTRKHGKYQYEMSYEDHIDLINLILGVKGKVMLSGYPNDLYKKLEDNGWLKVEFKTACYAAGRTRFTRILGKGSAITKQPRTEAIWMNYKLDDKLI